MSGHNGMLIIGALFVGAFIVLCIIAFAIERKKRKGKEFCEEDFAEPKCDVFYAKVINVSCDTHHEGVKAPKLMKDFVVFFELKNGKVISINVPEAYYEAFEIAQKGKLTLANEKFISFIEGEGEC